MNKSIFYFIFHDSFLQCQVWSANGTLLFNFTNDFGAFEDYENDEISYTLPKVVKGNTNFIVIFSVGNSYKFYTCCPRA